MGTGTIEIDDNRQLQLVTQYYKSQGDDDYGLWLGKKHVRGHQRRQSVYHRRAQFRPYPRHRTRHLISLQYSDADFFGQNLVSTGVLSR
ncbi:hypothetical protein LNP74_24365 [Klebsiella pneumoniae subsp. pneumoniae]|nr:hypothetical protein [Klebsiella pneumoniae subsp. pneumoniae]